MMIAVVRAAPAAPPRSRASPSRARPARPSCVPTADAAQDPKNTTAWFVAFAPADNPRVAVAVMLLGAGQGGASAAPIAKRVLQAAL